MELQNNLYLVWQITPALIAVGLGIYLLSRLKKKSKSSDTSILANLAIGIVVLDLENKIVDINPVAIELLDPSSSNLFGRNLPEILDHDPDLLKIIQAGLEESLINKQETVFRTKRDAKPYELRISGIHDNQMRLTGHLLQFTDISRQKQVEENFSKAKLNYSSQLDQLKDYFFETDLKGFVTNINL